MRYFQRFLIVLASAAAILVLRAFSSSSLDPAIESRFWLHSGELSEVLIAVLLGTVIACVPILRREMTMRSKGSWLILIAAVLPMLNLVFFTKPPGNPGWISLASLALGGFAVGINEEIFLRGFAFARHGESTPRFTVVLTALVFGLLHLFNLTTGVNPGEVVGMVIIATEIGLIFGVIRIATGSILWCAILHGLIDATFEFTGADVGNDQGSGAVMALIMLVVGVVLVVFHPAMKKPRHVAALEESITLPNPTSQ